MTTPEQSSLQSTGEAPCDLAAEMRSFAFNMKRDDSDARSDDLRFYYEAFEQFADRVGALLPTAEPSGDVDPGAREMLAAEYEAAFLDRNAASLVRSGETHLLSGRELCALRAITKALQYTEQVLERCAQIAEYWVPKLPRNYPGPATANEACPEIAEEIRKLKGQSNPGGQG